MKIPLYHGTGDEANANQEVTCGIGIMSKQCNFVLSTCSSNSTQWIQEQRNKSRHGNWNRLCKPVDSHKYSNSQYLSRNICQASRSWHHQNPKKYQKAKNETDFPDGIRSQSFQPTHPFYGTADLTDFLPQKNPTPYSDVYIRGSIVLFMGVFFVPACIIRHFHISM